MTQLAPKVIMAEYNWHQPQAASGMSYKCGYCDKDVAPSYRYFAIRSQTAVEGNIYICPKCGQPTFFSNDHKQTPGPRFGNDVLGISKPEVATLYKEVRDCASIGGYTPAVMGCRKILMNLAVSFGAQEDKSFAYYVDFFWQRKALSHLKEKNGLLPSKIGAMMLTIKYSR